MNVTYYKRIFLYFLLCSLGLATAKSLPSAAEKNKYDYDFAVYADHEVVTFKRDGKDLLLLDRLARTGEKTLYFWKEDFIEQDGFYYTKTTVNRKNYQLLARVNSHNLAVDYCQTDGLDAAYSMAVDEEFLYISNSYTDRLEFSRYDLDLNFIWKKKIPVDFMAFPNQMLVDGKYIYVLMGQVWPDGGLANKIWKMSKDFDLVEEIDLEYSAGALLRMVLVDNSFYITNPNEGLDARGEPGPAYRLFSYDLETGERKTIELATPYPLKIYYDEARKNLIIWHYELYLPTFTYTIYSLEDDSSQILRFPEYEEIRQKEQVLPPFLLFKDYYYFLFSDKIVDYNPDLDERQEYDLTGFNLTGVMGLLVNE